MGENHIKPTKEQLKKGAEEALKKLESMPKPGDNEPKPSPSAPVPSPSPSTAIPTPSPSEAVPSPSPSEPVPSPSPSPAPGDEDDDDEVTKAKKKASASAREALVLHARTKKYDEAVAEADLVEPPTDEEMIAEYGAEWETMSDGQKKLARNAWVSDKRFAIMSKVSKEGRDIEEWNKKVSDFIEKPQTLIAHPQLERKQEEFKTFAAKLTRRGLDMEDLVLAFLGELALNPKKKNKGQMFEKGSPGKKDRPQPKDDKLSASQGRALMKTDYKKWKQLLKAGKIRNE